MSLAATIANLCSQVKEPLTDNQTLILHAALASHLLLIEQAAATVARDHATLCMVTAAGLNTTQKDIARTTSLASSTHLYKLLTP